MIPDFPHNIRIRLAQLKFFCYPLTLLSFCPVGCLSLEKLSWDSQQGRDRATSGSNKIKFQSGQSYSYIMRKVWYHQIWIQNYLGFIVSDLMYILHKDRIWMDSSIKYISRGWKQFINDHLLLSYAVYISPKTNNMYNKVLAKVDHLSLLFLL